MTCTRLRFVLVLILAATAALAQGRGNGNGGGGGGGGGGSQPPTNPEIAFVEGDLKVMSADGSNVATVLDVGRHDYVRSPGWSPDNTQIAVAGNFAGIHGIHVVAADGSGVAASVPTIDDGLAPFLDWSPAPTPDSRVKIAFHAPAAPSGYHDIWVTNPDGTGLVNLTNTPNSWENHPAFSRSGAHLAFVRDADLVVAQLGVVSGTLVITGELVVYTTPTFALGYPAWARTQDLIVVSELRNGVMRLLVVDPLGSTAPAVVTPEATGDEFMATFSPDDMHLAYRRSGSGGGIFTIGIDGTGMTRIARKGYDPAWHR